MKPWRWWPTIPALIFVGIVGPGLAAGHLDPSTDDPAAEAGHVCQALDAQPSRAGLEALAKAIHADGYTYPDVAQVIVAAVWDHCPRHKPLLLDYTYSEGPVTA